MIGKWDDHSAFSLSSLVKDAPVVLVADGVHVAAAAPVPLVQPLAERLAAQLHLHEQDGAVRQEGFKPGGEVGVWIEMEKKSRQFVGWNVKKIAIC